MDSRKEVDMGYSNKTWQCPFFRWDERLCVHCEGGKVEFPDMKVRDYYINRYCADNPGWKKCTIASFLERFYEREEDDE